MVLREGVGILLPGARSTYTLQQRLTRCLECKAGTHLARIELETLSSKVFRQLRRLWQSRETTSITGQSMGKQGKGGHSPAR